MINVQAYDDGYDAYLRLYSRSSGGDETRLSSNEEPHNPYVDDPALYDAWLEGWKDGGGRSRAASILREAISVRSPPDLIPGFSAAWPMPIRTGPAAYCRMRRGA